jgi:hypothetical protein
VLKSIFRPDRRAGQKIRRLPLVSPLSARRSGSWLTHPLLIHTAILGALGIILAYGLAGLAVVAESEAWQPHAWVPRLLVVSSAFLIATTLCRIVGRWFR